LAFSVASLLKSQKLGTKNKQTSISLEFPFIDNNSCLIRLNKHRSIDTLATLNIDSFTRSILDLRIGAEFQTNYQLLSTVGGILRKSSAKNEVAVTEFLHSFDTTSNDLQKNNGFTPNLMIINVDPKNED
ncbi:MAG: hypothetical protein GXO79_10470, partial [Chlorobi bacterium]|nr:hypothetical protein [Chlorobiota bacterium]